MTKDPLDRLRHILESIEKIESYVAGCSGPESLLGDDRTLDAVVRRLEIIGEAVKALPESLRSPDFTQWKEIAGMRDILVHKYFGIDHRILWDTVKEDLPPLKSAVEGILGPDR